MNARLPLSVFRVSIRWVILPYGFSALSKEEGERHLGWTHLLKWGSKNPGEAVDDNINTG